METDEAVIALGAIAQETRLTIFRLLIQAGPAGLSVGEIGESVDVAPATLSFHLKQIADAGLINARQDGRFIFYSADYARMNSLVDFLTENCCVKDDVACMPVRLRCPTARTKTATRRSRTR